MAKRPIQDCFNETVILTKTNNKSKKYNNETETNAIDFFST